MLTNISLQKIKLSLDNSGVMRISHLLSQYDDNFKGTVSFDLYRPVINQVSVFGSVNRNTYNEKHIIF